MDQIVGLRKERLRCAIRRFNLDPQRDAAAQLQQTFFSRGIGCMDLRDADGALIGRNKDDPYERGGSRA